MANSPTKQDMEDRVDQLGDEAGRGKDVAVKFTMTMIESGYHNIYDLNKNKHGKDRDDASVMAERFAKKQNASAMFDYKGPNERKASSCARTGIKLGSWPKGGAGEPIATVNNFVTDWIKQSKLPSNKGRMIDANNALLSFARAQLKRDHLIDPSQFSEFMFKADKDEATAEEIIEAAVKKLDKLIDGSASNGTVQHRTANVVAARDSLRNELKSFKPLKAAPAKV